MRHRHLVALAVAAIAGIVTLFVLPGERSAATHRAAVSLDVIPPLPESQAPATDRETDYEQLQRCIDATACQLVHTTAFTNASISIYQQVADQSVPLSSPSVHIVTAYAESTPRVWSLQDEHGGLFDRLSCGLANCVLQLNISNEFTVLLDLRISQRLLQGEVADAALTLSRDVAALDLDGDGVLDAVVRESAVDPGQGPVPYYRTLHNQSGALLTTGCTLPGAGEQPTSLMFRTCPG